MYDMVAYHTISHRQTVGSHAVVSIQPIATDSLQKNEMEYLKSYGASLALFLSPICYFNQLT